VWDSWLAADGDEHHLFFLCAPRSLGDPDARHDHASVGHATSADLRHWVLQPAALLPSPAPAWDDMAIWTGSVAGGRMFYTGRAHAERGRVQRIGVADSDDLTAWTRAGLLLEADPRWYEAAAWRDPYVVPDPGGEGWHMLICAGPVIGHARSADLVEWEIQPPLTEPAGFGAMEVPRVAEIDGACVLMFSADGRVWVAQGESLLGPWELAAAATLDHPSLYAANFVRLGDGEWAVLGFRDVEDGRFVGAITDPLALARDGRSVRLA
jgi:beta-fructofuranosidase